MHNQNSVDLKYYLQMDNIE